MTTKYSWEDLNALKSGTIIHDIFDEGVRFLVMRGPASLCAYVGIPVKHPLAGFDYNDLPNVDAHGGLTFASLGSKESSWPEEFYWYGWDYGHSRDYNFYNDDPSMKALGFNHSDEKKWLLEDVISDSWSAINDFKTLIKFAEGVIAKEEK